MNIRTILGIAFITIHLLSCEETIKLDLDQAPAQLVIEGLVTNKAGKNYVKLTKTGQFYDKGEAEKVSGAQVEVFSETGENALFSEVRPGWYEPSTPFRGVIGETYTLSVHIDEEVYTASETIVPVNPFDSLTFWRPDDLDDDDAIEAEQFYELLVYYTEPQEIGRAS